METPQECYERLLREALSIAPGAQVAELYASFVRADPLPGDDARTGAALGAIARGQRGARRARGRP